MCGVSVGLTGAPHPAVLQAPQKAGARRVDPRGRGGTPEAQGVPVLAARTGRSQARGASATVCGGDNASGEHGPRRGKGGAGPGGGGALTKPWGLPCAAHRARPAPGGQ